MHFRLLATECTYADCKYAHTSCSVKEQSVKDREQMCHPGKQCRGVLLINKRRHNGGVCMMSANREGKGEKKKKKTERMHTVSQSGSFVLLRGHDCCCCCCTSILSSAARQKRCLERQQWKVHLDRQTPTDNTGMLCLVGGSCRGSSVQWRPVSPDGWIMTPRRLWLQIATCACVLCVVCCAAVLLVH